MSSKAAYLQKYLSTSASAPPLPTKKGKKPKQATGRPTSRVATVTVVDEDTWPGATATTAAEDDAPETQVHYRTTAAVVRTPPPTAPAARRARHDTDSEDDDLDVRPPRRRARHDTDSEPEDPEPAPVPTDDTTTVRRDVHGRRLPAATGPPLARADARAAEREQKRASDYVWAMGRVQREAQGERLAESAFARTVEDVQLNKSQREEIRWGDPGAQMGLTQVTKKKKKHPLRPTYEGPWAPNRFMISPGFRWDGIDRSNGYESKFLLQINEQAAYKEAAYRWSTEDM